MKFIYPKKIVKIIKIHNIRNYKMFIFLIIILKHELRVRLHIEYENIIHVKGSVGVTVFHYRCSTDYLVANNTNK